MLNALSKHGLTDLESSIKIGKDEFKKMAREEENFDSLWNNKRFMEIVKES